MQFFPATNHPSQRDAQKIHGKEYDGCDPGQGKERTDKEEEEKEEQNQGQAAPVLTIVDKSKTRDVKLGSKSKSGEEATGNRKKA